MSTAATRLSPGIYEVSIEQITVGPRLRVSSDASDLRESMRRSGLLHPITITTTGRLIAGAHRLKSAKELGWVSVRCDVRDLDDTEAELVEIDENLCHHVLTITESGQHLLRRGELLRQLGLRAEPGDNQHAGGDTVTPPPAKVTTSQLAGDAGISERTAQRHMALVGRIAPDVIEMVKPTPIANSGKDLDELGRLPEVEQRAVMEVIGRREAVSVAQAQRVLHPELTPEPVDPATDALNREASQHMRMVDAVLTVTLKVPSAKERTRGDKTGQKREAEDAEHYFDLQLSEDDIRPEITGLAELLKQLSAKAWNSKELRADWENVP